MASTDLVTAARRDIYVGDIEENRPNSENVNRKLAGNINFILERMVLQEKFVFSGFYNSDSVYNDGVAGIMRVEKDAKISEYHMAIRYVGAGGSNNFNCRIYDNVGAYVGNLFSTPPTISGSGGSRVLVGKEKIDTVSPVNFQVNTSGHSINHGVLSFTTLLAGWMLVPYVSANGSSAYNGVLTLKMKEI